MTYFFIIFTIFLLFIIYNLYIEKKLNELKLFYEPILFSQSVELDSLYRRSNFLLSMFRDDISKINEKYDYKKKSLISSDLYYLIFDKDRSYSNNTNSLNKISNKFKIPLIKKLYQAQEEEIRILFERELYLIKNCNQSLLDSHYLNQCVYINNYYSTSSAVRKAFEFDDSEEYKRIFNIKEEDMREYLKLTSMYYSQLDGF